MEKPMYQVKLFNIRFSVGAQTLSACCATFKVYALCFLPLVVAVTLKGQEIMDNFDLGADAGWQHFTPTTAGGAVPQYSFPNGASGRGYRMFAPPCTCQGILQRGGSYRSAQYGQSFYSVDLMHWDQTYG